MILLQTGAVPALHYMRYIESHTVASSPSAGVGTVICAPHNAHSASVNHNEISFSSNMQPTLKSRDPQGHTCVGIPR
jgi:hypothetical protein